MYDRVKPDREISFGRSLPANYIGMSRTNAENFRKILLADLFCVTRKENFFDVHKTCFNNILKNAFIGGESLLSN